MDARIRRTTLGMVTPADDELEEMLRHVAQAGFDPNALERAGGRLNGLVWQGRILTSRDMLPPAVAHFLRHVIYAREWPAGTTPQGYEASIRRAWLDPAAWVFTSEYGSRGWHIGVVAASGADRGPDGGDWILVEYRVDTGHWVTAYQITGADPKPALAQNNDWRNTRWLRDS